MKYGIKKYLNLKSIGSGFLVILLALIFLSSTIYNHNLPLVTAAMPTRGALNKLELASATIDWQSKGEVFAEFGGKIENIAVSQGDRVQKDAPLIYMSFDQDDINSRLQEIALAKTRINLEIENLNFKKDRLQNNIDQLEKEIYKGDSISDYDLRQTASEIEQTQLDYDKLSLSLKDTSLDAELSQLQNDITKAQLDYSNKQNADYDIQQTISDIEKAQKEVASLENLFNQGIIARQELDNAVFNLQNLELRLENQKKSKDENINNALHTLQSLRDKYDAILKTKQDNLIALEYKLKNLHDKYQNIQVTLAENAEKSADTLAEKEKNRQKQLQDYHYEIEVANRDIKTKHLELDSQNNSQAACQKALQEQENNLIYYAPEDMTIIDVKVSKGQYINDKQLVVEYGISDNLVAVCNISYDNNFVAVDDVCLLQNADKTLDGQVITITPTEQGKNVTVKIQQSEEDVTLTAGEAFDVKFEKESSSQYITVPNGAVNRDSDGYFLYQIKRRDGIMGKEFYTVKQRIYIGDNDSENTAVVSGIEFFEPIVVFSDKAFSEGDVIKLGNEEDFFAKQN